MAKFSKKSPGMHVRIRGVLARGFGGPCIQGPFMACEVCGDVVPIASYFDNPVTGEREPCYGECVNGHGVIEWLEAIIARNN